MSRWDNEGHHHHKSWADWSLGAKILVIAAAAVFIPGMMALCVLVTMGLWNWLMPAIFRLPAIGFWQALGLLILSQLLFKGGHLGHAGRSHWRKARIREGMREAGPEEKKE